jgi:transmembrane sensor
LIKAAKVTLKKQRKIIQKYLAGTASPEEIQWVDAWYNAFENQKTDNPPSSDMEGKSKQLILDRALRRNELHLPRSLYKYAAVFAAVLLIALVTLRPGKKNSADELVTISTDGKRDTTFSTPDSSTIWLKANSELAYHVNKFGKQDRTVQLRKGEAYFEVKRNPSLPFSVIHNRTAIHVLGTGFNVFTDQKKGKFDVMVSHGLVEVSHDNKRLSYLGKGEAINLNTNTGKFDTAHFNARYAAAWRNEEISLQEVSFKELSDVFYILYRMRLRSAHNASEKYTYTLVINKKDDYLSTLMIITSIHQNKFKVQNDTVLIY